MSASAKLATLASAVGFALAVGVAATAFQQDAAAVETSQPAVQGSASTITLPDFTTLVERNGDTVVNVTTDGKPMAQAPEDGPGSPFPFPLPPGVRPFGSEPPLQHGMGSGFIISADGYIVTNAHVVAGADSVTVKLNDKRELKAKVVGVDPMTDVAVVKVDATGLPSVKIGDPAATRVGEWVAAIGAPFGMEHSVTSGIVSAKSRNLPSERLVPFIQTDVAVNPGNSGGPLFNMAGEVIGVNSQIYSTTGGYMGVSFAIPIDVAMKVKDELVAQGGFYAELHRRQLLEREMEKTA